MTKERIEEIREKLETAKTESTKAEARKEAIEKEWADAQITNIPHCWHGQFRRQS